MNLTKKCTLIAILLAATLPDTTNAATRTWTGGGADANWSTSENWGGTAPVNGDTLVFAGTAGTVNTNNLLNLSVAGLRFESGGFQLYGNPINLTTSVSGLVTNRVGLNTIHLGLSPLQSNKRWEAVAGSELILAGTNTSTTTSGGIVMLDGGGTVRFTGGTTAVRGIDITNGTVVLDGGFMDHTTDGMRFKSRAGATAAARLRNNGTWRWGGGANLRLGNTAAAGTNRMDLDSGTLELYGAAVSIFVGDAAVAGSSSIFNQNGGTVLSTGTGNNDLVLGTTSGAESVYNLNGGVLMVRRIRANSAGQGVLNFNGGVLMAKVNDAAFVDGLAAAYIKSGGAIINSSSNSVSIIQSLTEDPTSPGGGLTKLGSGSLTFSNANNYTGPTRLGSGSLGIVAWGYPSASTLTLSNGTTLNLDLSGGATPLASPSVTLDDNTTLNLNYGLLSGNPAAPAISDASTTGTALTARGVGIVLNLSGSGFVTGQFPLIKYSGVIGGNGYAAFTLGALPPGVLGKLVDNTANRSIDLNISLVVNALTWNGNLNANWDIGTTANWKNPLGTSVGYVEYGTTNIIGDVVTLDDSLFNDFINPPNTNINLTTTLQPAVVNLSGNSTPYSLSGAGKLSGGTILKVLGIASLTISNANDFTGGTTITAGSLLVGNDQALGVGPVILAGGTLGTEGSPRTISNAIQLTATSRMNVTNSDLTLTGPMTSTGNFDLFVQGGKNLIVKGPISNIGAGGTDIQASRMVIDGASCTNVDDGIRLYGQGVGSELEIKNGGVYELGLLSGNPNLRLGQVAGEAGTNILRLSSGLIFMRNTAQAIIVGDKASTTGMVYQTGGTIAFRSSQTASGIAFGSQAGSYGEYHLDGGVLDTPRVYAFAGSLGTFYFNGGTLRATTNFTSNPFFSGVPGTIQAGGAIVDSAGLDVLLAAGLDGVGGLTKIGQGSVTLTGTNTYSGPTLVNAGKLIFGTDFPGAGGVVVADGATAGFLSSGVGVTVQAASVTVGSGGTASLEAQFAGRTGNPTVPAGNIANLTLNGTVAVNIVAGGIQPGTFPLIRYGALSGTGTVTTGNLPQGVVGTVVNNTGTKTIEFVVTSVKPLVWTAAGSSTWDVGSSTNWSLSGVAKFFQNGDNVLLDDSAANPSVVVVDAVNPGSIQFSNSVLPYFVSVTGAGKITGSTGLTKDGTGNLLLYGPHDYTGDVIIKNGILTLGNVGALGSTTGGTYVTNGGTLNMANIRLAGTVEPILIAGRGYADLGALYSDAGNGNADFLRDLRLTADAWVGAATGMRYGYNSTLGTITCVGGLHKFTKVGGGQFDFQRAAVTVGEIEVLEGILQIANESVLNSGYGITVRSNAEFRLYQLVASIPRPFTLDNGLLNSTGGTAPQNQLDGEITLTHAGTLQVGGGFSMTLTQPVKGSGDLIKSGGGLVNLEAANTYTGGTIISNGTLTLGAASSITASPSIFVNGGATLDVAAQIPWTLAASQTLRGSGTINGSVTANGTVSPGASIGVLTFNNDLALAGTNLMEVTAEGGLTNDIVSVLGALTYGGQLQVVVSGATPLAVNNTFKLFSFAVTPTGNFSQINLPSDYTWDTTQLAVDGTVRVTGVSSPPALSVVQVDGSLQISWSGSGYKLQAQTNSPSVGLSGNWGDYSGGGSSPVAVPIDPANGTVFFRLAPQ